MRSQYGSAEQRWSYPADDNIACENGRMDGVTFLVEHGANVNIQDKAGNTPLMLASKCHHMSVVIFLVKHGANIDLQDKRGHTSLMLASIKGHCDLGTFFVTCGANMDLQNNDGLNPLMEACKNGSMDVVTYLVEHGVNVNLQDKAGNTPLILACKYHHMSVVIFLVKHGADVNLQDKNGKISLHHAIYYPIDHSSEYYDGLSCLIKNRADVNAHTHGNWTPLMIACRKGHGNTVNILAEHGANMDFQDKNGDTALHFAVRYFALKSQYAAHYHAHKGQEEAGSICCVDKLLTLGASQLYNNEGLTPLLQASNESCRFTVEHLLKEAEYTKEQRIDALELLGTALATSQFTPDTARAFHYIKWGMTERFKDPSQPFFKQPMEPVKAYHFSKESQTLEELAQIEGDRNAIMMEGLVIRERILGTDNPALLEPIRYAAS